MRHPVKLLVALTIAGLLSSCGVQGSDDTAKDPAVTAPESPAAPAGGGDDLRASYEDALASSIADDATDFDITADQADCIAVEWVDVLDPARLSDAGITAQELSEGADATTGLGLTDAEGGRIYDAYSGCGFDVNTAFVKVLVEDLPGVTADCLDAELEDDAVRQIMVATFIGAESPLDTDPELGAAVLDAYTTCGGSL